MQELKLYAELSFKERLLFDYKQDSMIYKFYLWLNKNKGKKNENKTKSKN